MLYTFGGWVVINTTAYHLCQYILHASIKELHDLPYEFVPLRNFNKMASHRTTKESDILTQFFFKKSVIFNFLFYNTHDKFDRQIIVSNQINLRESWKSIDVVLWSDKEFVVNKAWTHCPGQCTYVQSRVRRPLGYPGAPLPQMIALYEEVSEFCQFICYNRERLELQSALESSIS